jgi:uncharacterized protein YwqG
MNTDEILAKIRPWREKQARRAWKPKTVDEDGSPVTSKFSGIPWLDQAEAWPSCGECHTAMPFFLQLNISEFPEAARSGRGSGLIQLFYCLECDGGWEPFSKVSLARLVPQSSLLAGGGRLDRKLEFPAKRIATWEEFVDYPHPPEHDLLGLSYRYDFSVEPSTTRIECLNPTFIAEGIDDDDLAEKISLAESGDKLGGWPYWIQGVEYPLCPACEQSMRLIFQVDSEDHLPFLWGDMGTGHITQCPAHPQHVAFGWACS